MKTTIKLSFFLLAMIFLCRCEKDEEETTIMLPTVVTGDISVLNSNSVFCSGELVETGGAGVWEQGVVWSIRELPSATINKVLAKPFVRNFEVLLTGLVPNTTIYARAYAINSKGMAFGEYKEFKTPALITGTFTDNRDGRIYKWVELGTQTWMAENMAYMPYVCPPDSQGGIWVYDYYGLSVSEAQLTEEYKIYGNLYDWDTAYEICPEGWHLPSDDEWKELELYLGMNQEEVDGRGGYSRGANVGNYLKENSTKSWRCRINGNYFYGTNVTDFNALPCGFRSYYFYGEFLGLSNWAYFYTSTIYYDTQFGDQVETRGLHICNGGIGRRSDNKYAGLSVRCIKD